MVIYSLAICFLGIPSTKCILKISIFFPNFINLSYLLAVNITLQGLLYNIFRWGSIFNYNWGSILVYHIQYVIKSCISDKAKTKIKANCNKAIENIQKSKDDFDEIMNIQKYNSTIIGIHNYYQIATMVCCDLGKIAYEVSRTMYVKLRKRVNRKCNKVNKKG